MEKLKYRYRKIRNKFLQKYYNVEGKIKYPSFLFFYKSLFILEILFVFLLVYIGLVLTDLMKFPIINNNLINFDTLDTQLNRQIIFSQVSLSFLILSLLSFLTNLKKDKLLGTSIYSIIFAYSIFGNLTVLSVLVFSLLFLNLSFFIVHPETIRIPYFFLLSMLLLSIYIIKIIIYTNNKKKSINKICTLYYMENRKIIKNNFIPHLNYYDTPKYLNNLFEDTGEKIKFNNIEYIRNFQIYEQISNLSLINYRKEIQENYTEGYRKKDDVIKKWIEQIYVLLASNELLAAIEQYNLLLNVLIRREVFLSDDQLSCLLSEILSQLENNPNFQIYNNFEKEIKHSMQLSVFYSYFRLNNDFTYTRLGRMKDEDMLYLNSIEGDFYKKYYNIIRSNKNLSDYEKDKKIFFFIDYIRMSSFSIDRPFQVNSELINYNYYDAIGPFKRDWDGDLELIGIPLSVLLYEVIRKKDNRSIYQLVYEHNSNSIYYALLIVLSKLVRQYLKEFEKEDNGYILEIIKLLSLKLELFDDYKLKLNKNKILKYNYVNSPYQTLLFLESDEPYLKLIYHSIQMKKHKVNYKNINDKKLKCIYKIIVDDEVKEDLLKKWKKFENSLQEFILPKV